MIFDILIYFLTQPNHYFAESFVLDILGLMLWLEELILQEILKMDFSDNRKDTMYTVPYIAYETSIAHYKRKEKMWK